MDAVILELSNAVIRGLGLMPEYPENDENQLTLEVGDDAWTIFTTLKGYTRGVGFVVDDAGVWHIPDDLQAVLVTATSRYVAQSESGRTARFIEEWTANEQAILHQYRLRAG